MDGPFEMRKAVRDNIKHGVDQIKLMVTGDVMQGSQLMLDEITAATEVAHQRGIKVCAHAWNNVGVKMAIQGGVDCIEHGLLDDESIEMMVEHDLFYVPTLLCTNDTEIMQMDGMPKSLILKANGAELHLTGFQKAMDAGVKIACGGDYSPVSFFTLLELEHLVRAGMGELGLSSPFATQRFRGGKNIDIVENDLNSTVRQRSCVAVGCCRAVGS